MSEKIVIIGNGFDLSLGLKTSYKDFIESDSFTLLLKKENSLTIYLNGKQEINNWVDIEKELTEYSKLVPYDKSKVKNDFKEFKFSLQFAGQLPEDIPGLNEDQLIHKSENEIVFKVTDYHNSNHILQSLISNGVSVKGFNEILPSLNEIFIQKVTQ